MKTLVSLSFILAVFLGRPPLVAQKPVLPEEDQHPLLGGQVPVQGHVVEEVAAPQIVLGFKEKDKLLDNKEQIPLQVKGEPDVQVEQTGVEEVKPEVKMMSDVLGKSVMGPKVRAGGEVKDKLEPQFEEVDDEVESEVQVEPELQIDQYYFSKRKSAAAEKMIASRGSCNPGVTLEGKHYQFFKGPKRAEEAEFFCQKQFPLGHLASITSQHIHKEVMSMMLRESGRHTRTWVGGLRYLKTGRFVWLDGSHWGYADWLPGEPNHTSNLEDCVELLASGKFNDFTCWEPQAFICSYPV